MFLIEIAEAVARLDQSSIQTTEKDGFVNIGVSLTGTLDVPVTVKYVISLHILNLK